MLEKIIIIDLISVDEFKNVLVRQATRILEDKVAISEANSRWVLAPGDDISKQEVLVQAICKVAWSQ